MLPQIGEKLHICYCIIPIFKTKERKLGENMAFSKKLSPLKASKVFPAKRL
jgi:hypothetical protein